MEAVYELVSTSLWVLAIAFSMVCILIGAGIYGAIRVKDRNAKDYVSLWYGEDQ